MDWEEAVKEAKEELGYGRGYLSRHQWEEVVETAKDILSEERDREGEESYEEHIMFYNSYIKSHEWAIKRRQRLVIDKGQCQDCGCSAEHVHHITYERLGHEEMNDLVSLCHKCHGVRHGK